MKEFGLSLSLSLSLLHFKVVKKSDKKDFLFFRGKKEIWSIKQIQELPDYY